MAETVTGLVSTIIPVYNRPDFLVEAVTSVLAQTHRPIEVVIVDDGSTDATPATAERLRREHPDEIVVLRRPNAGPGLAREAGRLVARGEFIQYLDSDDLLWPRKFEVQVAALRARHDCGVAYGYTRLVPLSGEPRNTPYKWTGRVIETIFPGLLVDRWWETATPLYRRSVTDRVGPWTDLRWSQDWEYDGRVGALRTKLVHCAEFVSDHRKHAGPAQTSLANWFEPERLRARKRLLELLFEHAEAAGVSPECPERQHFSRWVFAHARHCASQGLVAEARECLVLAERAAGPQGDAMRGLRAYRTLSRLVGWKRLGTLTTRVMQRLKPSRLSLEPAYRYEAGSS